MFGGRAGSSVSISGAANGQERTELAAAGVGVVRSGRRAGQFGWGLADACSMARAPVVSGRNRCRARLDGRITTGCTCRRRARIVQVQPAANAGEVSGNARDKVVARVAADSVAFTAGRADRAAPQVSRNRWADNAKYDTTREHGPYEAAIESA